ncbi:ABC transporter substrate-binding protein [Paenibacillus eucommiae]|uniref:Raffinose/stachyose/melibiose transport system substrate-binding protein n=1 Tax=Paenibacillus eucommiae TaxID=1355755 RepID=A0ABS4JAG2_9BACL|nr:extracellular solute-binding protein [Paenibacillus eucommiae]MBP1996832.1 raffinose/stachyose/melibiose transport system substrate-binding protein [Paenibacillus eucommiae]
MKKAVSMFIFFCCSVLILSACSTKENDNKVNSSINPVDKPKEIKLKVSLTTDDLTGIEQLAKDFEAQNKGVTVQITRAPDAQFQQTLNAGLATQDAPDLFLQWPGASAVGIAIQAGYMTDLSSLEPVSKIDKGLLTSFSAEDKVYAIPWAKNFLGVYYNKTLFDKNGLKVPTNWNDLLEAAEQLKAAGVTPFAFPEKDSNSMFLWFALAPSTVYAKDIDWDRKRYANEVKFASSEYWKATADQFKLLFEKGYLGKDVNGISTDAAKAMIAEGKAAMIVDGNWGVGDYEKIAEKAGIVMGMFPLPGNQAGETTWLSAAPSTGLGLWSGSENQETAKKFIEFIYADENVPTLIGQGQFSTLSTVNMESNPIFNDILNAAQNGPTYQFLDVGQPKEPSSEAFISETQAVLGGASTFEKVLEVADKSWDKAVSSKK